MLICNGHCFITKHNGNLYAFKGTFGGELDVYYQPRKYIVSNPALNYFDEIEIRTADSKLTDKGVLAYNDKLMVGLMPMMNRYSYLLAENILTLRTADIMLRILALISAPDDRTKVAADLFLKNMEDGKIGSIAENRFFDGVKMQNPPSNNGSYVTQFIELNQYLLSQFYNEIGLRAEQNMKRESLSESEISVNDDILQTLVDNMLKCREEMVSKLNEIYGTNISVKFSSSWADAKYEEELELKQLEGEIYGNNIDNSADRNDDGNSESVEQSKEDVTIDNRETEVVETKENDDSKLEDENERDENERDTSADEEGNSGTTEEKSEETYEKTDEETAEEITEETTEDIVEDTSAALDGSNVDSSGALDGSSADTSEDTSEEIEGDSEGVVNNAVINIIVDGGVSKLEEGDDVNG